MDAEIKNIVVKDYSKIAENSKVFGTTEQRKKICRPIYDPIAVKYREFTGYKEASDLGLGCGFPFYFAKIKECDSVLDLGCAAGIDSFITSCIVGPNGFVYGLDITTSLLEIARANVNQNPLKNIEFINGDIESLPFDNNSIDVVISNGVFSLLPDKQKAFHEIYRVLKQGGNFCIADMTYAGIIPPDLMEKAMEFTGCLNGISLQQFYPDLMKNANLENIKIADERIIEMPYEIAEYSKSRFLITTYTGDKY